jgi:RNase P/RNase MRP subunit p29
MRKKTMRRRHEENVTIEGEIINETPKAYLVDVEGTTAWIAKSQIVEETDTGMVIPYWLAREKELV